MKTVYRNLLIFALVLSCKNEEKLTFESLVFNNDACGDCPEVVIEIPKVLERTQLASTINTALEEEIISILNFDEAHDAETIPEAILSFKEGYRELKEQYVDEAIGWEAHIKGDVLYEDKEVLTIALDTYLFTGGAHGYSSKQFLNFDKQKSKELENWQLFKDLEAFQGFAEMKFRTQENIPKNKPINHTGFMFDQDSFYLPDNIGFTPKGIQLHYNPYEVASYADGPIELILPYEEVKNYLAKKSKS